MFFSGICVDSFLEDLALCDANIEDADFWGSYNEFFYLPGNVLHIDVDNRLNKISN